MMETAQLININGMIVEDELNIYLEKMYEELRELMEEYRIRFENTNYRKYKEGLEKNKEVLEEYIKEKRVFSYTSERIKVHKVSLENNRILLA